MEEIKKLGHRGKKARYPDLVMVPLKFVVRRVEEKNAWSFGSAARTQRSHLAVYIEQLRECL